MPKDAQQKKKAPGGESGEATVTNNTLKADCECSLTLACRAVTHRR